MGIIDQNMAGDAPTDEPMPPSAPPAGAAQDDPDPNISADTDPAYKAAIALVQEALYKAGAAKDVATAIKSASDPVEGLANTAYEMIAMVDERTEGAVPDELLIELSAEILTEVADIAVAAGVKISEDEIAGATKMMLQRYIAENGGGEEASRLLGEIDPAEVSAQMKGSKQ